MAEKIDWTRIDTVFLDMDGTLLDLHFDTHFWLEHVPRRYAEVNDMTLADAKRHLMERYQALTGQLRWYSIDHWSEDLGLDIALLKEEVDHLIAVHPHVLEFLEALEALGKRRVLVTNAHQKSIALKMQRTPLRGHLEEVICAHDLGLPKEDPVFWQRLQEVEPFDSGRTLFIDDSPPVLASARDYGIHWLLMVLRPDTRQPPRERGEFPAIHDFSELLPLAGPDRA